ncbi:MAG TPA: hypothetical protein VJR06_08290, partial [Nitrososphaerales archaeon]|nr:hypothetical protein [Nitrososphaerales archaeon]
MELSRSERRVMGSLCDTLFPAVSGDSEFYGRDARGLGVDALLAEAVERSLQPGNANDFRRILSVVENPIYNLVLSGRPVRFTSLSPEAREKYLESWRDSSIPLKRTAF